MQKSVKSRGLICLIKSQPLADYLSEKRKTNSRKLKDMVKKGQLKNQPEKIKDHQEDSIENLQEMRKKGESIALLYHTTGEHVIIVMGAINALKSRISGTLTKYNSCIA